MGNGTKDRLKLDGATADKRPGDVVGLWKETHLETKQNPCFWSHCVEVLKLTKRKTAQVCTLLFGIYLSQSLIYLLSISHNVVGHIPTNHPTYWVYPNKCNVTVLFKTFIPILSPFPPLYFFFTQKIQYSGSEWSLEISGTTETVCLHIVCAGVAETPRSSRCITPETYRKRTNNSLWESHTPQTGTAQ